MPTNEAVGPEGRRVTDGEGDEMVDPFGGDRRQHPRHRGAPVVPDHMRPLHTRVLEHGPDVGDQEEHVVGRHVARLVRGAVAAHVGNDDLEPGVGKGADLLTPQPP